MNQFLTYVIMFWAPILTLASVLFLWCSYYVNPYSYWRLRRYLMYGALSVAGLSLCVTPVAMVTQWDTSIAIIQSHPVSVMVMLVCNAVSFLGTIIYTALFLRPRFQDKPQVAYYSPLPFEVTRLLDKITGHKQYYGPFSSVVKNELNEFNSKAIAYSYMLMDLKKDDCIDGFMKGAAWGAGETEIFPDEVQWLKSQHMDVEEVQRALIMLMSYRASGPIGTNEPGYTEHPNPVLKGDVPLHDDVDVK
ncbi:hypothetical protein [Alloscardovia criceti]|uniref:hypothetical protein n=1 Tax=Alloscardovia criceti TaxID=356828 RepID=UPI0003637E4E|nr:hypothetical protein [Alloscardovia criceti]